MKYLLDTDHISFLQRRSGPEYVALATRIARHAPADFALSVVSFHEQTTGAHAFVNRARRMVDVIDGYILFGEILQVFMTAVVLPFDAAAAMTFNGLRAQPVRVPTMDLRIGSIALSRGLIVLTRNRADFGRIPGLLIEDWTV